MGLHQLVTDDGPSCSRTFPVEKETIELLDQAT
jgi:hypothetical protein